MGGKILMFNKFKTLIQNVKARQTWPLGAFEKLSRSLSLEKKIQVGPNSTSDYKLQTDYKILQWSPRATVISMEVAACRVYAKTQNMF